jgi:hypothetical protein
MRVYFASKSKYCEFIAALGAAGLPLSATWPHWRHNREPTEPTADEWRDHATTCMQQAADCDVLVLYVANEQEQHLGALLECGAALGTGKRVFLITPHPWPFLRHHPNVRSFPDLQSAIAAIMREVAALRVEAGSSDFGPLRY